MTPQHRALLDDRFTELAKTEASVETFGLLALYVEGLTPGEEHPECKVVLERVATGLRDRERALRKSALRSGPGGRHGGRRQRG